MSDRKTTISTTPRETSAAIEKAAADWVARLDRGPLSAAEEQALNTWAEADPRRLGAFGRAQAANLHLDRLAALGPDFTPQAHPVARQADRRRWLLGGAAVAATACAGMVTYAVRDLGARMTTRKGDIRRAALADGSAITLNTDSAVRPGIGDTLRRVDLLRGEALFDVAKDPSRPFVVTAGDVRVRAVGTSFTVRRREDGAVTVMVREGIVEVWRNGQDRPIRLTADQATAVPPSGAFAKAVLTPGGAERATAWRQGEIDLNGLTLDEAAKAFGRYSDRAIQIDDAAVGALQVTGLFSVSDPEGFARAAALSLGLTATSTDRGVRLSR